MATGDTQDILARIKAVLPRGWFPDVTPVLDGVLSGPANGWAFVYSLLAFVKLQARRLTASGVYLDMIAADFFGTFIKRRLLEPDGALSKRIGKELFREKGTRAGLIGALTDLTGRAPIVFEPANTFDTGGWDTGAFAFDSAGGWGEMDLPFQFFVTAYRPSGQGVANVGGFYTGSGWAGGGWGVGAIEWVDPSMFAPQITDQDILNVIEDVRPAASIAWTRIFS